MRKNWQSQNEVQLPAEVQALFREYRETLPDFDASPEFMPKLWQGIEAQQKATYSFWRLASGLVTGSVALSMALAFALWTPPQSGTGKTLNSASTYVEVLAADASEDTPDPASI